MGSEMCIRDSWMLDDLLVGKVNNEITVPEDVKRDSKAALERMLSLP